MAQWAAFAGLVVLSVFLFLALARASQAMVTDGGDGDTLAPDATFAPDLDSGTGIDPSDPDDTAPPSSGVVDSDSPIGADDQSTDAYTDAAHTVPDAADDHGVDADDVDDGPRATIDAMSTSALLLNVAVSQGVFGALVLVGAWYTEVPLAALGVSGIEIGTLAVGVGVGIALYAGNAFAAAGADALGFTPPDDLRAMLAPDSIGGWALLLLVILPAIAFVEELLFRAALIGAISVGFSVSPWALAIISSIAFALGHGAQGSVGMVVTGSLGLVLAATFVLTGSLFVVVIAHYIVNALEFVVHEGLGIGWSD